MLSKIIAQLSCFIAALGIGILVMIYGWGLTPQSWWWILGGGVGIRFIVEIMQYLVKEEKSIG